MLTQLRKSLLTHFLVPVQVINGLRLLLLVVVIALYLHCLFVHLYRFVVTIVKKSMDCRILETVCGVVETRLCYNNIVAAGLRVKDIDIVDVYI